MVECSVDFETRSAFDLKAGGVYAYSQHPTTGIWCLAYAFGMEEDVGLWYPGEPCPPRLWDHVQSGGLLRAWNAQFERIMWRSLGVRLGLPSIRLEQWICTAAEAAAMDLPRRLETCATVLKVPEQKDREGHLLMMKMSRPRSLHPLTWWDEPAMVQRLGNYCKQDVRTERSIGQCVRRLVPSERALWLFDQRINDRGVMMDRDLIEASRAMARRVLADNGEQLSLLTNGMVQRSSQTERLKVWLKTQEVEAPTLAKPALRDLLTQELPGKAREALQLRSDSAKSSLAKLDAMLTVAGPDDILRGLLLYHGAGTGRWSGKLVQPQNFTRPEILDIEGYIPLVMAGEDDTIDAIHPTLSILSWMLRSCLRARPGHRFVAADYSGIEARIVNWLAGQWDIVARFARGENIYFHNASHLFNLPMDADKESYPREYQGGKAVELGCGFQMGWKKFRFTAKDKYELDLSEEEAQRFVKFYRDTHPMVVQFWRAMNYAAMDAVRNPGETFWVGQGAKIGYTKRGGYLYMILPSKRPLCYASPTIVSRETPWSKEAREVQALKNAECRETYERLRESDLEAAKLALAAMEPIPPAEYADVVQCWGVDPKRKCWAVFYLYGGLLTENAVQAIARDFMAHGMVQVEQKGYPVVLTVHDEVVADVPQAFGSVAEYERLLTSPPEWSLQGPVPCPITAKGWEGQRYRK